MKKNKDKIVMGTMIAAGLLLLTEGSIAAASHMIGKGSTTIVQTEENPRQTIGTVIQYQGESYAYNTDLRNYLVLGIDQREPFQKKYTAGTAGQSDFMILLSVDQKTEEGKILQIHRNSMTSIDLYDDDGNYTHSIDGQITLQYAYGIGGEQSCWATKQTVSRFLYNLDIDGYIAINGVSIDQLVDAFGGIDVTVSADYTDMDERLTENAKVHMDGALARKYIQERDTNVFDSATDRMKRQKDFMIGLSQSLQGKGASALYEMLLPFLDAYILTDLTGEEMKKLASCRFDAEHTLITPGETVMGEELEEFQIDEEELQKLLIQNFYIKE